MESLEPNVDDDKLYFKFSKFQLFILDEAHNVKGNSKEQEILKLYILAKNGYDIANLVKHHDRKYIYKVEVEDAVEKARKKLGIIDEEKTPIPQFIGASATIDIGNKCKNLNEAIDKMYESLSRMDAEVLVMVKNNIQDLQKFNFSTQDVSKLSIKTNEIYAESYYNEIIRPYLILEIRKDVKSSTKITSLIDQFSIKNYRMK